LIEKARNLDGFEYDESYEYITGDILDLRLISYFDGNDVEIPYYWYDIILKDVNETIGKISIRLGENYHSYYNGHVGYEIDEDYRGHNYAFVALQMVLDIARDYGMQRVYITCNDDNIASYKTIEKLAVELVGKVIPPKDYFAYYEGMPVQRIYSMKLNK